MMMTMPNTPASSSSSSRLAASISSSTRNSKSNKRITSSNNSHQRSRSSLSSSSESITPQMTSKRPMPDNTPEEAEQALAHVDSLKFFLATAPTNWKKGQVIRRYMLPNGEPVSCVLWNDLFYITGTDIMRCLNFRFQAFGRPVVNAKKFEESVFSNLRNLKAGTNATLEEPKSAFLEFLHQHDCIRTQKKQKVFYWYAVPHDLLFIDVLERDFKRERAGLEPVTKAVKEPALSFRYDLSKSLQEKLQDLNAEYRTKPDPQPQQENQNSDNVQRNLSCDIPSNAVGGFKTMMDGGREGTQEIASPLRCQTPVSMLVSQDDMTTTVAGGTDNTSPDVLFASDLGEFDKTTSSASFDSKFLSSDDIFSSPYSLNAITGNQADSNTNRLLNSSPLATILNEGDENKLESCTSDNEAYRAMFQSTLDGQALEEKYNKPIIKSPLSAGGGFPATFWWMSDETVPISPGELGFAYSSNDATIASMQLTSRTDMSVLDVPNGEGFNVGDIAGVMPALNPPPSNVGLPEATCISSIPQESGMISADSETARLFADSGLETVVSSSSVETTSQMMDYSNGEEFGQQQSSSGTEQAGMGEATNTPASSHIALNSNSGGRLHHPPSTRSSRSPHYPLLATRAGTPNNTPKSGGYKNHTCPVGSCRRIFKRSEHLRRHVRTHTQERPYICAVCQKGFSRSDNLSQHRRTHRIS